MKVLTRYQLRMANPDKDAEIIARLKVICWREAYTGLLPQVLLDGLDFTRATRDWHENLKTGIAWIAEQSGEPVGFGHSRNDEVTTLYVRKTDHRNGVGAALLNHCFDEIGCLGYKRAHLWVLENNFSARRFYQRQCGNGKARRSVGFSRWPDIMEIRYEFNVPD